VVEPLSLNEARLFRARLSEWASSGNGVGTKLSFSRDHADLIVEHVLPSEDAEKVSKQVIPAHVGVLKKGGEHRYVYFLEREDNPGFDWELRKKIRGVRMISLVRDAGGLLESIARELFP
jgi:hypothetical protein